MTGQELVKMGESQVFKPVVMDTIINEFEPDSDAFYLTKKYLPFKEVRTDQFLDMIKHGGFGRTSPVNLNADHHRIAIPGQTYKSHQPGYWRESVQYGEDVLQKAVNPQKPLEKAGEHLVTEALNLLSLRLDVLIEYVTAKILADGQYSEARNGVNYTYNPKIPAKYLLSIGSVPWTGGGVAWTTPASAKPVNDILGLKRHMAKNGMTVDEIHMTVETLELFYNAADTQAKITASPALVEGAANREFIFETLTNLKVSTDERTYAEETTFLAASPVGDTTLQVANATEFADGETIVLRNALGEEEDAVISGAPVNNVITVASAISFGYQVGDRVTVYKKYLADNDVIAHTRGSGRASANNWISTPSLVKAKSWKNPLPGRYTWTDFQKTVPYHLEIGAGIDGGPKVTKCNWARLRVV